MTKIFLTAHIDAPGPPDWLDQSISAEMTGIGEDQLRQYLNENKFRLPEHIDSRGPEYTNRVLHHPSGDSVSAFTNIVFFDHELTNWAKENVTPNTKDMRYSFTAPGKPRLGPHVDLTRKYTLIYLVESGGDAPKTVFYKEKDQEMLIRPLGYHVDDYNKLEEIISIVIPLKRWTIINSGILHSVENINQGRKSYQISLDNLPDLDDLKNSVFLWQPE
jgi:hypothetical protein